MFRVQNGDSGQNSSDGNDSGGNHSDEPTGGGTYIISWAGSSVESGTYDVTGLVSFHVAPGSVPSTITDTIGDRTTARAGLAVLKIMYSDGSDGILIVSCHLPVGSPMTIFEGITATKGYVDFWNREAPKAGVDANRTNFHEISTH